MSEEHLAPEEIRVVVVDDHLVVREGLRLILEKAGKGRGFVLVGDAADGTAALRVIEETQPDVVLMDIRMPGMDGLETIERMRALWPQIAVVILTTYNEDDLILRGLRAGACGYLLKDASRETLFQAISAAARGELLVRPETMARILSHTTHSGASSSATKAHSTASVNLTERERAVLTAVARGERNKEIALRLGVTEHTIKAHLASIYSKLDVDSRASAVARAIALGILSAQ
ncbi:MAG TPA: response regulator transcription factor [Ktedonobacteraceae bacterium]|nr:response regulator transcription factor [Ktedonobacteraceae bacterium]